ncbi:hypothetical protein Tco_0710534 [Tanacetum coccineum]
MKAKLALLEASPSTSQSSKPFQSKNEGLVAETFDWDDEEVSDDEEMTQVKVLMDLADDELSVGKNHARNVTSSVPTEVKTNDQESKVDELTKLVQMLIDEKINSIQKTYEPKSVSSHPESSKTSDHDMHIASLKSSNNYKAQPYQYASSSKQILKSKTKPFPPCTYCGFNEHRPDNCRNYHECEICGSYDHFTSRYNHVLLVRGGVLAESSQPRVSLVGDHLGKFDANADDGYFLEYSFDSKAFRVFNTRRQQIQENYHVIFDESMEAIKLTHTSEVDVGINDSSRYPLDEFLQADDPSRQYKANCDILY